jgi:DtxR family transcriptional regulator, Mn-dependent transcriptional regulator
MGLLSIDARTNIWYIMADHKKIGINSMAYHIFEGVSESIQMYLITCVIFEERGAVGPIPISTLARELGVQPVSAHQMVRKLDEEGLVKYTPYKGVELTLEGERLAAKILRNRRLWEVLLVEQLGLPFERAHEFACMVEHITSLEIAECLSQFLGDPKVNPHGKSIPSIDVKEAIPLSIPLSNISTISKFHVVRIEASDINLQFLRSEGIYPGAIASIRSIGNRGDLLLESSSGEVYISRNLANSIHVQIIGSNFNGNIN